MKLDKQTFKLEDAGRFGNLSLTLGIIGLIGCAASYHFHQKEFFPAYLTAYAFWASIGLGALFFTLLHHLVGATWSVVLRRLAESVMATLPIMLILFIPVAFGLHDLYHWSYADAVAHDELLQIKEPFLNQGGFIARTCIYFLIWFLFARSLYKTSLKQDQGNSNDIMLKMRRISAPGMLLYALTSTFAAFDWLMSLDPHWYSTIFGVYFFAGSLLSILAFMTIMATFLRKNEVLHEEISVEHYHDLGKLIFAFTVFWAYIAFSQYFLIWYGNLPEETVWYLHRWEGGWKCLSLFLLFGHFVFPFIVLLSRVPKRNVLVMTFMAVWMLFIHWIDMYWIIIPNFNHHFHFSISDLVINALTFSGVGGIFLFCFWKRFSSQPIIPVNDPELKASIQFVNA